MKTNLLKILVLILLASVMLFAVSCNKNGKSKGAQGPQGEQGEQGEDGLSAYQIWLANGNSGTEQDFLNWLKGLNDHNYGEWQAFGDTVDCSQRMFFRVCEDCNKMEWKHGSEEDHKWAVVTTDPTCQAQGYDTKTCEFCQKVVTENYTAIVEHDWQTEYAYDNTYHWFDCKTCDSVDKKQEHNVGDTGECQTCLALVGATEGVIYDTSLDGTYVEVIDYEGSATTVHIAETYNNLPVKAIYEYAFYQNETITSVIIPDSVLSIGDYAFYSCDSLTSVVIGDSVTTIGNSAFCLCTSLTSIVIPDSVTTIGEDAFNNCNRLTSVVIGDSVTTIGNYAFQYCHSLTSVVIGDSVTTIGSYAFANCSSLQVNEYVNCKYLGSANNPYYALIEISSKNYLAYTLHNDTVVIAGGAFSGCSRITTVTIPNNVKGIGASAFYNCTSLTSVVIGDSVTIIGSSAFSSCASLTSVVIPDSVTIIGNNAFESCASLTSVEIPDSVTTIGDYVFESCSSLTSVYITDLKAWCEIKFGDYHSNPLYHAEYLYLNGELLTELTIPDSVTTIGSYAFYNLDSLTSVVIPDSVTTIGRGAFASCSSLTSVEIGDGVTTIGDYAFAWCSSLTSIKYKGTEAEWLAISKGSYWKDGTGNYTITYNYQGE